MSRKIIVTIVSDQTVPNVLFIKHFGEADHYHFVSTSKMDEPLKVSDHIIKAADLDPLKTKVSIVKEDSLADIENVLHKDFDLQDDDEIHVNITGGTKIMSLGVYNYFARQGSASIYYIPIGKNQVIKVFPLRKHGLTHIEERLTLKQYLTAYGVTIKNVRKDGDTGMVKDFETSKTILNVFADETRRMQFINVSETIRISGLRGRVINSGQEYGEKDLFSQCMSLSIFGMKYQHDDRITRNETKYITGDWFEEYVYSCIKNIRSMPEDHISLGLQLDKSGNQNEYDIIFTLNNALYVIECKTDVSDGALGEEARISQLFTSTLYKAATLKKEFGLWVNYYLFALNDFTKLSDQQLQRAKQLDIKLVGLETIRDEDKFREYILKM